MSDAFEASADPIPLSFEEQQDIRLWWLGHWSEYWQVEVSKQNLYEWKLPVVPDRYTWLMAVNGYCRPSNTWLNMLRPQKEEEAVPEESSSSPIESSSSPTESEEPDSQPFESTSFQQYEAQWLKTLLALDRASKKV